MCFSTPDIPTPEPPPPPPPPPSETAVSAASPGQATKDRVGGVASKRRRGTAGMRTAGLQIMS